MSLPLEPLRKGETVNTVRCKAQSGTILAPDARVCTRMNLRGQSLETPTGSRRRGCVVVDAERAWVPLQRFANSAG